LEAAVKTKRKKVRQEQLRWLPCFLEQKRKMKQPARKAMVKNIK
jgi:hypothetical protein